MKDWTAIVHRLLYKFENDVDMVSLCPFYQFRLEVNYLICYLVDVYQLTEDSLFHKLVTGIVSMVKIKRTYEGLKSVSPHIAVVRISLTT